MITATGNNFGAYTIQLKDYQSDKMVVLNGRFELNPESEDYIAAKQLEKYVPDLSLPKSTIPSSSQPSYEDGTVIFVPPSSYSLLFEDGAI